MIEARARKECDVMRSRMNDMNRMKNALVFGCLMVGSYVSVAAAEPVRKEGKDQAREETSESGQTEVIKMKTLQPLVLNGLRDEVQTVSASTVDVISGGSIAELAMTSVREALLFVPNVGLAQADSARASSFSVRGSRELTFHEFSGGRTGVGYYLDDIPVMDAYGRDLTMFDVEGVSFYKGPHGSSMGVPHSMGVVDITTRAPGKDSRGAFSYRYGSYESHTVKGHLSGALAPNLFLGLDGLYAQDEGWFEDRLTGDPYGKHETASGRARLRWLANECLEFDLTLGISSHDDEPPVYQVFGHEGGFYDTYTAPGAYATGDQSYQALKVRWKQDGWLLKSITSHRKTGFEDGDPAFLKNIFYPGSSPRTRDLDATTWTQELRMESTEPDADWRWRGGLFFSRRDSQLDHFMLGLGPWEGANEMDYEIEDYVLYGELSHRVNACLDLSVGVRLQMLRDHTRSSFSPTPFAKSIGGQAFSLDESEDFSAVLPMASAAWEWSPAQKSYVRLSSGMQPGGLAVAAAGSVDYDSEYAWHYELGHDSSFREDSVRLHLAAFYTDYDDYQSFQFNPAGQTIYNADDAHAYGVEAELRLMPCRGLELYAGVGYTRAKFDDFQSPIGDFSGNKINNIPVGTINAGVEYKSDWGGVVRLDWRYVGDTWFDEGNTIKQDAYSALAARVGYERGDYGVYLYGSNLFDEEYYTQAYRFQGIPSASPGIPRIVGVEVKAAF